MSIKPLLKKMLDRLADPLWVRQAVATARCKAKPACAAFLSTLLVDCRLLDPEEFKTWTSQLVGTETDTSLLEQRWPVERITHPADIRPGDIVASRDRNDNNAPDHVFTVVGMPEGADRNNPFVLVVDNYCTRGKPYWRNLGKSGLHRGAWRGKTPMAYALRIIAEEPALSAEVSGARYGVVLMLAKVYAAAAASDLSQQTMHHLNQFRHSPELREFKPGSGGILIMD